MNSLVKKVLCINLAKGTSEVRSFADLKQYIGGVGLGLKIYSMYERDNPIVFSIGPLNGYFPFVSKTSVVLSHEGVVEDIYLGGSLSFRIAFSGLDSIVLLGKSRRNVVLDIYNDTVSFEEDDVDVTSLGLPGKRAALGFDKDSLILDNFFYSYENFLAKSFKDKNINGLVITGSGSFPILDIGRYESLYKKILARGKDVFVEKGLNPSCSGCPLGCMKSRIGEMGGNILCHSLVACGYAQKIYSDASVVFSCLDVLGYDYTHEDLEALPKLVEDLLED